jgi:hypothetical protein
MSAFHEREELLLHEQTRVSESGAIYGQIRTRASLRRLLRRSFARECVRRCNGVNGVRERSRQRMIRGPSARDNSIVMALCASRARVQRLREIKTNVLSLAHLHGEKIALRADG